eukprot:6583222-Prorocentrum_lima.AAC.1
MRAMSASAYRPLLSGDTKATSATAEAWASGAMPLVVEGDHHMLFDVPAYDWSTAPRLFWRHKAMMLRQGAAREWERVVECRMFCFLQQLRSVVSG